MNGDVRLRVEGLMLERLILRALNEGAQFRRIQRDGARAMIVECDAHSAAILTGLCQRFSLPCRVLSRRGRDAMLRRLRQRATLLAGAIAFACTIAFFAGHIWTIDVELTGGREGDPAGLVQALDALGVRPGVPRSSIDPELLQDALSAAAPDFSFVGVRVQGVRLLVEAAPAVSAPETYHESAGHDLVAAWDGVILSVNAQCGEAAVQPGDTVRRGQTLILGEERVSKEAKRAVAARGVVTARIWWEGSATLPLHRSVRVRTGRVSTASTLRLMDFIWPLTEGETWSGCQEETEVLPLGGLFVPLEILRTTRWETRTNAVPEDETLLKSRLTALARADAAAQLTHSHLEGVEIADEWMEYIPDGQGNLRARAVLETHTDIAITRDALYQQGG